MVVQALDGHTIQFGSEKAVPLEGGSSVGTGMVGRAYDVVRDGKLFAFAIPAEGKRDAARLNIWPSATGYAPGVRPKYLNGTCRLRQAPPEPLRAIEGTYRETGPRKHHRLHADPVPAWVTAATVRRTGPKPNSYEVRVTTARAEGCDGDVTVTGTLVGQSMRAVADPAECALPITFKGSVLDIREEGNCTSFRGAACSFGGSLPRVSGQRRSNGGRDGGS